TLAGALHPSLGHVLLQVSALAPGLGVLLLRQRPHLLTVPVVGTAARVKAHDGRGVAATDTAAAVFQPLLAGDGGHVHHRFPAGALFFGHISRTSFPMWLFVSLVDFQPNGLCRFKQMT